MVINVYVVVIGIDIVMSRRVVVVAAVAVGAVINRICWSRWCY